MSDRTPHLNRLLIFIIIILCLICGLLFTQSSAGPFGNSHTSVIAENTGDIAVLSSDKDQNIKLNISGTDISVSPSATPSPTPVKEQDAENVSPEAESGTWTADGTNWKFMVNGKAYTGWLTDTDGKQYYFDKAGIMQTGWVDVENKRYYMDLDGIMQTGDITVDGKTYHLNADGSLQGYEPSAVTAQSDSSDKKSKKKKKKQTEKTTEK